MGVDQVMYGEQLLPAPPNEIVIGKHLADLSDEALLDVLFLLRDMKRLAQNTVTRYHLDAITKLYEAIRTAYKTGDAPASITIDAPRKDRESFRRHLDHRTVFRANAPGASVLSRIAGGWSDVS